MCRRTLGRILRLAAASALVLAPPRDVRAQQPPPRPDTARLESPYHVFPRAGARHLDLSADWELASADRPLAGPAALAEVRDWVRVATPTSVQMALHAAGRLPHPYLGLNSRRYAAVDEQVWYYRKRFVLPAAFGGGFRLLAFDGLDYYARVWMNGRLLGSHEGMFGGPTVDVSDVARPGAENELVVELRAANYGTKATFDPRTAAVTAVKPWYLAGGKGIEMFFPVGMWRGVRLEAVPRVHLERPALHTARLEGGTAVLARSVELLAGTPSTALQLHPWQHRQLVDYSNLSTAPRFAPVAGDYRLRLELRDGDSVAFRDERPVTPVEGRVWVEDTLRVPNARLWWPNGMGEPRRYQARLTLLRGGSAVDEVAFPFGVRTLQWRRSAGPRTDDRWADWQFVVNGRPFFAKGVNWMPADQLYDLTASRYRWLLEGARHAGVQLVRVWGGGLVEPDAFYDETDRLGLLVFQDFPTGNRDTPNVDQRVWEAQVVQTVARLRNRPSLAVWSGGNEFNPYSLGNAATTGILERSLATFDPTRLFLRTSPDAGGVHLYPDVDPTWYRRGLRLTPFVEESGIHSVADAAGIRAVVAAGELQGLGRNLWDTTFARTHPEFVHHFAEYGPGRVPRMLSRASHLIDLAGVPVEALAEATQVGAGEFYQVMAEGVQANYPVTTGLMAWVYNRTWPVTSAIHLVDGTGQPGAPYYFLKRAYEPTHVQLDLPRLLFAPGDTVPLRPQVAHAPAAAMPGATVTVRVMDDAFRVLREARVPAPVAPGPSVARADAGAFVVPAGYDDRFLLVTAELRDARGALVSRSAYWPRSLAMMRDSAFRGAYLRGPQPWPMLERGPYLKPAVARSATTIRAELLGCRGAADGQTDCRVRVANTGDRPAFMTQLDVLGAGRLSRADDNFFWLGQGETRTLVVAVRWRGAPAPDAAVRVWAWNAPAVRLPLGGGR